MKRTVLTLIVAGVVILAGCEKIRLNKLEGYWELETWELTDASGTVNKGMDLFPDLTGDEVLLEFTEDGRSLMVVFENDTLKYADAGRWESEDNVGLITYTDSVLFFNVGVPYEIDKLTKNQLEISGVYTYNGTVYQSVLEFKGN